MGCGQSSVQSTTVTQKTDDQIKHPEKPVTPANPDDVPIKKANFDPREMDVKILTLGAGECGKTTIWRQFKISYCDGFTNQERIELTTALRTNIMSDIMTLIQSAQNSNQNIPADIQNDVDAILECDPTNVEDFTKEIAESISHVWNDPIIKQVYQTANSIGIGENADFFLENAERIAKPDYKPTNDDILKARIRTVGVFNLCVDINGKKTVLVDVGGQRNERRNWQRCFENVSYVMFVVSLSDFDQSMFEDEGTSRTADSIELFKNIASTEAFRNTPFFLVLNKFDIFKTKIKRNPEAFHNAYPGFQGDINNEDECIEHIKNTFLSHLPSERSAEAWIEAIPTCAMNETSVRSLFQKIAKKIDKQ